MLDFSNAPPSFQFNLLVKTKPQNKFGKIVEFCWSQRGTVLDGDFYAAKISRDGLSRLQAKLESCPSLFATIDEMTITIIAESKEWAADIVQNYRWDGAECIVYAVEHEHKLLSDAFIVFKGFCIGNVEYENGLITIHAQDLLRKEIQLPIKKFGININDDTYYPRMDEKRVGDYIPLVFGDWSKSDDTQSIECVVIDKKYNNHDDYVQCKVLEVGELGLMDYVDLNVLIERPDGTKNIIVLDPNNIDYAEAKFVLTGYNFSQNPNDKIYVKCRGWKPLGIVGEPPVKVIENPASLVRFLLTNFCQIPTAWIDDISFQNAISIFEKEKIKVRRRIAEPMTLDEILEELAVETGLIIRCDDGLIKAFVPDLVNMNSNWVNFFKGEMLEYPAVEVDPDNAHIQTWTINYNYNPRTDKYLSKYTSGEIEEDVPQEREIIDSKWLYLFRDAQSRALLLHFLYSRFTPKIAAFQFAHRALGLMPLDGFWAYMSEWTENPHPFLTVEVSKDFLQGRAEVKALWLGYVPVAGRWTSDAHPSFKNSTESQKRYWGYWTYPDGSEETIDPEKVGRCDPADSDSYISNWMP